VVQQALFVCDKQLMNTTFTLNELAKELLAPTQSLYDLEVKDSDGKELHPLRMVPGYGGWGNNSPTEFITIRGRKALFVDKVSQNTLRCLRLRWA
jgi:hypothetical protein